jgi:hypothetical protein
MFKTHNPKKGESYHMDSDTELTSEFCPLCLVNWAKEAKANEIA